MSDPVGAPDSLGTLLRRRRALSGLTQRELSIRSGIPQPNISAYESGRRAPDSATLNRLDRATRTPTLFKVRALRSQILEAAERGMVENIRIFGSVARGDADDMSDLDLLVHPLPGASLIEMAAFVSELEELFNTRVDVVSDRGDAPLLARVLQEAIPL